MQEYRPAALCAFADDLRQLRQAVGVDAALEAEVRSTFGSESDEVLVLLNTYGSQSTHREVDRVRRAILTLSRGEVERVRHNVEVAQRDYRDVLCWAEYPPDPAEPKSYQELRERLNLPPD